MEISTNFFSFLINCFSFVDWVSVDLIYYRNWRTLLLILENEIYFLQTGEYHNNEISVFHVFHNLCLLTYCVPYWKKKSRQSMTNFFADDYFYRRLIFIDEYSYRHFFNKREHLVFSNLKIPLVYLFDFKFN